MDRINFQLIDKKWQKKWLAEKRVEDFKKNSIA